MDWSWYAAWGVLVAVLLSAPLVAARLRELKLSQAGLGHAAQLTDEYMLAHMTRVLGALGYRVQRAQEADPDLDLILVDGLGQRSGVFLRHWRTAVDEQTVQKVAQAGMRLGKSAPLIVTIDRYTQKARDAAAISGVVLWGLADLTRALHKVRQTAMGYPDLPARPGVPGAEASAPRIARVRPQSQPAPVAEGEEMERSRLALRVITGYDRAVKAKQRARRHDDDPPRCPRCGKIMVLRQGKTGEYWSCPNFPRCLGSRAK